MSEAPRILVAIADGTEEIEVVVPIDLFRRAGFSVLVVGEKPIVTCSRGTKIVPDKSFDEINEGEIFDLIFLPGGSIGTENLLKNGKLDILLRKQLQSSRYVAAICAAPTILLAKGLLGKGFSITSHPTARNKFRDLNYLVQNTVVFGNIITSRGAGTAINMALKIIEMFQGSELAKKIANDIVYDYYK